MKKCIIDVGTSYNAPTGLRLKEKYGYPVIFIEPDKEALDRVFSGVDDIKLNVAITSYDGEIEFNYYQEGTHSILKANTEEIHKYIDGYSGRPGEINKWTAWKTEKVKCMRLDTIINQFNIEQIVYLKIDTQGHDFEVIKSLGDKINIVLYIECEVQITDFEIYKNQSKKDELIEYVTSKGFKLIGSEKQTFDQEENLLFENMEL